MTNKKCLSIGTRTSLLALKQTDEVMDALRSRFPDIELDVVSMSTLGDANKAAPLETPTMRPRVSPLIEASSPAALSMSSRIPLRQLAYER